MLIFPTNKTKLQSVILFFSLFTLTAIVILFLARNHITDNIYPGGDLAADMLLVNKIDDEGFLLTGQYSRYKFNHPGPFFSMSTTLQKNYLEGSQFLAPQAGLFRQQLSTLFFSLSLPPLLSEQYSISRHLSVKQFLSYYL